jgi:hypothetical protein
VISRYLVIALALGVMIMRLVQHAWVAAAGLGALATGLVLLQAASGRPRLRPLAWAAFTVTAVTMVLVWMRMRAA